MYVVSNYNFRTLSWKFISVLWVLAFHLKLRGHMLRKEKEKLPFSEWRLREPVRINMLPWLLSHKLSEKGRYIISLKGYLYPFTNITHKEKIYTRREYLGLWSVKDLFLALGAWGFFFSLTFNLFSEIRSHIAQNRQLEKEMFILTDVFVGLSSLLPLSLVRQPGKTSWWCMWPPNTAKTAEKAEERLHTVARPYPGPTASQERRVGDKPLALRTWRENIPDLNANFLWGRIKTVSLPVIHTFSLCRHALFSGN